MIGARNRPGGGGIGGAARWRPVALLLLLGAALASVAFVSAVKPNSATAFAIFAAWLALPHLLLGGTLWAIRGKSFDTPLWDLGAVAVGAAGIVYLAEVVVWHPDAQGGIAMLMTPILQSILAAVLLALAVWRRRA